MAVDSGGTVDGGEPLCVYDDETRAEMALAATYLEMIRTSDYETSADWFPLFEAESVRRDVFIGSGHRQPPVVAVWQNRTAHEALEAWVQGGFVLPLVMPNGSIIVKQNYDDRASPEVNSVTIMVKDTSLDTALYPNGWFFMKTDSELQVQESCDREPAAYLAGNVAGCTNCHNGRSNLAVFPDPGGDPTLGGLEDGLVPYDYLISAFCRNPANETFCRHGY